MVAVHSAGTRVNDFVSTGSLGLIGGARLGAAVDALAGNRVGMLANLADGYLEAALGRGTTGAERVLGTGAIPAGLVMPSPSAALATYAPYCGACYAVDPAALGALDPSAGLAALGAQRLIATDPAARQAVEAMLGGTVVGAANGALQVQRTRQRATLTRALGAATPGLGTVASMLQGMDQAVLAQAAQLGMTGLGRSSVAQGSLLQSGFMGVTTAGLMSVAGLATDNSGAMGGQGYGSWNPLAAPGRINNTNPYYESAHQAQAASLLADPSLTVEDKVTLLLMLIMNKMDDDIERQAQYVNSIQQQQSARSDESASSTTSAMTGLTSLTGSDQDGSPSIDVETMKLKRMVDKRSQMFDMLRQIIDKYNETAKGIIQSIGR